MVAGDAASAGEKEMNEWREVKGTKGGGSAVVKIKREKELAKSTHLYRRASGVEGQFPRTTEEAVLARGLIVGRGSKQKKWK